MAEQGVALYYSYAALEDPAAMAGWLGDLCRRLELVGRVRVSEQGVNVTVGGSMEALKAHIQAVGAHPNFAHCDFKLDSCRGPLDTRIAAETGFSSLSVRVVKELVTLGPDTNPNLEIAGRHVSPHQFHSILSSAKDLSVACPSSETSTPTPTSTPPLSFSPTPDPLPAAPVPLTIDSGGTSRKEKSVDENVKDSKSDAQFEDQRGDERRERRGVEGEKEREEAEPLVKPVVVLDVRNVYESRIGKFQNIPNVEVLEAPIRQFSDLPKWLEGEKNRLENRHILMYCTGGVRCESASAYVRAMGPKFNKVDQLSGGIVRYLEAYPDGGYFSGKNFVFDHRIAVGSNDQTVVGTCLICEASHDDYSARCRCASCRMLVIVCHGCQEARGKGLLPPYRCELCSKGEASALLPHPESNSEAMMPKSSISYDNEGEETGEGVSGQMETSSSLKRDAHVREERTKEGELVEYGNGKAELKDESSGRTSCGHGRPRKLRILCLHGFRQSAVQFRGRTAGLQKKLRNFAEFVFIDAPHAVPLLYQPRGGEVRDGKIEDGGEREQHNEGENRKGKKEGSFGKDDEKRVNGCVGEEGESVGQELGGVGGEVCRGRERETEGERFFLPQAGRPRYAWLVDTDVCSLEDGRGQSCGAILRERVGREDSKGEDSKENEELKSSDAEGREDKGVERGGKEELWEFKKAKGPFSPLQYMSQRGGWEESKEFLLELLISRGPFDGVLGFSQGAAVASALSAFVFGKEREDKPCKDPPFSFVILCSGFRFSGDSSEGDVSMENGERRVRIPCPSLHIFGGGGEGDRQISTEESERLVEMYNEERRVVVRHGFGHIIPIKEEFTTVYKKFLQSFL